MLMPTRLHTHILYMHTDRSQVERVCAPKITVEEGRISLIRDAAGSNLPPRQRLAPPEPTTEANNRGTTAKASMLFAPVVLEKLLVSLLSDDGEEVDEASVSLPQLQEVLGGGKPRTHQNSHAHM